MCSVPDVEHPVMDNTEVGKIIGMKDDWKERCGSYVQSESRVNDDTIVVAV